MLTFSCVLCVKSAVQLTRLGPGSVGQGMSPAPGEWWGVQGGTPLPLLSPYQRRLVIRLCKQLLLFWFSCDLRLFPPFFFFFLILRAAFCPVYLSAKSLLVWVSAVAYSEFLLKIQTVWHHTATSFVWQFLQEEPLTFVITMTTFHSWSVFRRGICWFLIYMAFVLQGKIKLCFIFEGYDLLLDPFLPLHFPFIWFFSFFFSFSSHFSSWCS